MNGLAKFNERLKEIDPKAHSAMMEKLRAEPADSLPAGSSSGWPSRR